jgi:hypothetical protein
MGVNPENFAGGIFKRSLAGKLLQQSLSPHCRSQPAGDLSNMAEDHL